MSANQKGELREEGLTPRRFGLTFAPPSLTVVYTALDGRKARRRNIPIRRLSAQSDPAAVAAQLARSHADLLGQVQPAQLEGLCRRLVEAASRRPPASAGHAPPAAPLAAPAVRVAGAPPAGDGAGGAGGDLDLNRLDDAALAAEKAKMDVAFRASRVAPGDAGYEYDRRVAFVPAAERSEWDEELEDFSSEEEAEDLFGRR